jgi:hypothetical protein
MPLLIVPLAGPDFYSEKFGIRPLYPIGNLTLIETVFSSRPWISGNSLVSNQIVFVLRDEGPNTKIMQRFIKKKYPSAQTVLLSSYTVGAPLSALAGISIFTSHRSPVVIDLADISFDMPQDFNTYFFKHPNVDAIVPYFNSEDPKFSYLKLDGPNVIQASEKQIISSNASVGVYFFRDVVTYLKSIIFCLENPKICKCGNSFYICPSLNGLIVEGRQVHALEVKNVQPFSAMFRNS